MSSGAHAQSDRVVIQVKGQDGVRVLFRFFRHQKLKKLLKTYCEKANLEYDTTRFYYDEKRVTGRNTLAGLGIEEGGEINAFKDQDGGGYLDF